jgi:HPt (histidine-containing phosphotransfer) domain-containing protein
MVAGVGTGFFTPPGPVTGNKAMKDNHRSRVQRLTGILACKAQQLLRHFRQTPEPPGRPAQDTRSMNDLAEEELAMKRRRQSFSSEIFAELLIELPGYQRKISQAHQSGDRDSLGNHVHQLLGAVAYCDAPELEAALRKLYQAIKTEAPDTPDIIDACYTQAFTAISSTLHYSGYRGS